MNRRTFVAIAAAIPLGGITVGKTFAFHTELNPRRLFLPGSAWGILAFVGQRHQGITRALGRGRARYLDGVFEA